MSGIVKESGRVKSILQVICYLSSSSRAAGGLSVLQNIGIAGQSRVGNASESGTAASAVGRDTLLYLLVSKKFSFIPCELFRKADVDRSLRGSLG